MACIVDHAENADLPMMSRMHDGTPERKNQLRIYNPFCDYDKQTATRCHSRGRLGSTNGGKSF